MTQTGCARCRDAEPLAFDFSFAFQPIVHYPARTVVAYEALVRGLGGESAFSVLEKVTDENRYQFDQAARYKAITPAHRLMGESAMRLSINFFPNAVYDPVRCLRTTLSIARETGFALDRLMFELTEHEKVADTSHLKSIVDHYATCGFTVAIDDFGAGFAGLNLLAEFRPHVIKLDRKLLVDIDQDDTRQAIVSGLVLTARTLNIAVIAEGIETPNELNYLRGAGIEFFQGYLFARPGFETLPEVDFAALAEASAAAANAATTSPSARLSVFEQPLRGIAPSGPARIAGAAAQDVAGAAAEDIAVAAAEDDAREALADIVGAGKP